MSHQSRAPTFMPPRPYTQFPVPPGPSPNPNALWAASTTPLINPPVPLGPSPEPHGQPRHPTEHSRTWTVPSVPRTPSGALQTFRLCPVAPAQCPRDPPGAPHRPCSNPPWTAPSGPRAPVMPRGPSPDSPSGPRTRSNGPWTLCSAPSLTDPPGVPVDPSQFPAVPRDCPGTVPRASQSPAVPTPPSLQCSVGSPHYPTDTPRILLEPPPPAPRCPVGCPQLPTDARDVPLAGPGYP